MKQFFKTHLSEGSTNFPLKIKNHISGFKGLSQWTKHILLKMSRVKVKQQTNV